MNRETIFISGIHGVGKSTICDKLSNKYGIARYTCSDLIRKINDKLLRENDKRVHNINKTQEALILGVEEFVKEDKIILDGHFCLLDDSGKVERIPEFVFEKLELSMIIVLYRDAKDIEKSLLSRDQIKYNYNLLNNFQEEEIKYAKEIASKLNIPFIKFDVNNSAEELYEGINDNI